MKHCHIFKKVNYLLIILILINRSGTSEGIFCLSLSLDFAQNTLFSLSINTSPSPLIAPYHFSLWWKVSAFFCLFSLSAKRIRCRVCLHGRRLGSTCGGQRLLHRHIIRRVVFFLLLLWFCLLLLPPRRCFLLLFFFYLFYLQRRTRKPGSVAFCVPLWGKEPHWGAAWALQAFLLQISASLVASLFSLVLALFLFFCASQNGFISRETTPTAKQAAALCHHPTI